MQKSYREIKNDLIHCPFNPNHLVKRSRLITHKKCCPDKGKRGIVQCPYNPSHHVLIENIEKHKEKCPERVIINPDLANEMEAYIKSLNNGEKKNSNIISNPLPLAKEGKENDKNLDNEIIGLDKKKMKKKAKANKKKKEKKVEEKCIDLENISNKELFNYMFNDRMCIEYDSDSSQNNDGCDEHKENGSECEVQKDDE